MIHQRYELSSDTLELCKGKLVPGIAATWGEITGNIENQKDLVSYISAHGGNAEWGSISGNLSDQTDLMGYMDRFATTAWIGEQDYLHKYNASEDKSMIFNTNVPAIYLRNTVSSQLNINPWTISMFGGSTGALITPNTVGTHMGEASSYKTAGAICDTELSSAVLIVRDAEDYLKIDCHNIYTYSGGIGTTYPLSQFASKSDLSQYATRQWVTGRGYATESWVSSQGYYKFGSLDTPVSTHDYLNDPDFSIPSEFPWEFTGSIVGTEMYDLYIGGFYPVEFEPGVEYTEFGGLHITPYELTWYTVTPYDDGEGLQYTVEDIPFVKQNDLDAYLGSYATKSWVSSRYALNSDLAALASRVTDLETNYGDAVTITNNILGV